MSECLADKANEEKINFIFPFFFYDRNAIENEMTEKKEASR